MIVIRATQVSTKLRADPYTETAVNTAYGVVYGPSIEVLEKDPPDEGTFERGLHRISGHVFAVDNGVAETLFAITAAIDLIVRYTNDAGQKRKRTFSDVLFAGEALATEGLLREQARPAADAMLFGVPFVVQIRSDETIGDHVSDEADT